MQRRGFAVDLEHNLRAALARSVIRRDADGDDLPHLGAADHDVVLRCQPLRAQEIGGDRVGVAAEQGGREPGKQRSGGDQRDDQLHRLFPSVILR